MDLQTCDLVLIRRGKEYSQYLEESNLGPDYAATWLFEPVLNAMREGIF
jgi:hypothetical protein